MPRGAGTKGWEWLDRALRALSQFDPAGTPPRQGEFARIMGVRVSAVSHYIRQLRSTGRWPWPERLRGPARHAGKPAARPPRKPPVGVPASASDPGRVKIRYGSGRACAPKAPPRPGWRGERLDRDALDSSLAEWHARFPGGLLDVGAPPYAPTPEEARAASAAYLDEWRDGGLPAFMTAGVALRDIDFDDED